MFLIFCLLCCQISGEEVDFSRKECEDHGGIDWIEGNLGDSKVLCKDGFIFYTNVK